MSFKAGTIFQDSHLPVAIWFRAMWHITSQRNGIGASDLQRVLGLGSYKTAWTVLQKLRRVMVLPRRGLLEGVVEVDLTSWGQDDVETGAIGWQTRPEGLIAVAAQEEGKGVGRICVLRIRDRTTASLHKFVAQTIAQEARSEPMVRPVGSV
jgi:hypothetical protein